MLPPGFDKVIQSFSNAIAKMTNPFTPLLLANLILDFFSIVVFVLYRHVWVMLPAAVMWLFTMVMYAIYALKAPHMLSSTTIQKFGMQISAGLGQKGHEISEDILESLPSKSAPPKKLPKGNKK